MNLREKAEQLVAAGQDELESFRQQLLEAGLTFSVVELVVWKPDLRDFTAELKVELLHDGNVVDLFEFFVVREGIEVVSQEEIRLWIRQHVPEFISMHGLTQNLD
jgi:hypothetical protein